MIEKKYNKAAAKAVAFIGHRELSHHQAQVRGRLRETILQAHRNGTNTYFCGMALDFDMMAAEEVLALKSSIPVLKLIAVVPFKGQSAYWPMVKQQRYAYILSMAGDVNRNPEIKALGYAVSIRDVASAAFSDSLGVEQETSASLEKEDGNENTHAMYRNEEVKSPLAVYVFDMWRYGQSAYIPSVKQLTYLYQHIGLVNQRIEAVGGLPISLQPGDKYLLGSVTSKCKDYECITQTTPDEDGGIPKGCSPSSRKRVQGSRSTCPLCIT